MNELSKIIDIARKENWCTKLYCTTCGAEDFRKAIKKYSRSELIENLKELTQYEIDSNRHAVILCFYEASLFKTGRDLYNELQQTPSGDLLEKIFEHQRVRDRATESAEYENDYRKKEKLKKVKIKASYDIFGAIRRKDFLAIDALIAKGADLTQKQENGLTLEDIVKSLKEKKSQ
jgi:hypothetical protein